MFPHHKIAIGHLDKDKAEKQVLDVINEAASDLDRDPVTELSADHVYDLKMEAGVAGDWETVILCACLLGDDVQDAGEVWLNKYTAADALDHVLTLEGRIKRRLATPSLAEAFVGSNPDGQDFSWDDGRLEQDPHVHMTWRDGYGTDTYRHEFRDGSAIVVAGAGWDFGINRSWIENRDFTADTKFALEFCWSGNPELPDDLDFIVFGYMPDCTHQIEELIRPRIAFSFDDLVSDDSGYLQKRYLDPLTATFAKISDLTDEEVPDDVYDEGTAQCAFEEVLDWNNRELESGQYDDGPPRALAMLGSALSEVESHLDRALGSAERWLSEVRKELD